MKRAHLAVTAIAGLLTAPGAYAQSGTAKTAPEVRVDGRSVDQAGDPHELALSIARRWLREPVTLRGPGVSLTRSRQGFGARFDLARLERWLRETRDSSSPLRRARRGSREMIDLPIPFDFDHRALFERLLTIKDRVDRPAQDARIDVDAKEVLGHEDGRRLDVWSTMEAFEAALDASENRVDLVVTRTSPAVTGERLEGVSTDARLGSFRTHYNIARKAEDRTFNLRVAAARFDGKVLLPGEEFDFNEVVGERNEANGFRVAPVIAAGELVDGIGGGTCQVSGTLHAAVFFAGLPVLERRPHSRPSTYIKLGLDAAVAYPALNFRFRNDRPFPIVLSMKVEDGWVAAEIRGREHGRQVSFVRRIDEALPFAERDVEDPDLPTGVRVLAQRGVPGFKLRRWRIIRDLDRNQAVREAMRDEYPPTSQVWSVGTGAAAPDGFEPPVGDDHPEYVADEYLALTQGDGLDQSLTVRRPGRYGSPGWAEAAGLSGGESAAADPP